MPQFHAGKTPEQLAKLAAQMPTTYVQKSGVGAAIGGAFGKLGAKLSGTKHVAILSEEQSREALLNTMMAYDKSHTAMSVVKEAMEVQHKAIEKSHDEKAAKPVQFAHEVAMHKIWDDAKKEMHAEAVRLDQEVEKAKAHLDTVAADPNAIPENIETAQQAVRKAEAKRIDTTDPTVFKKFYDDQLKMVTNEIQADVDRYKQAGNKGDAEKGEFLISQLRDPAVNTDLKAVRQMAVLADVAKKMDADHQKWNASAANVTGVIDTTVLSDAIEASKTKHGGHLDQRAIEGFKQQIEALNKSVEELRKIQAEVNNNPSDLTLRAKMHEVDQRLSQIAQTLHNDNTRETLVNAVGPKEMKALSEQLHNLQDKVPYDHKLSEATPDTRKQVGLIDRFHDLGVNKLPSEEDYTALNVYAGRQRRQIPIVDEDEPKQRICFDAMHKERGITIQVRSRDPETGAYSTRTEVVTLKDKSGKPLNCSAKEAQLAVHEFNQQALRDRLPGGPKQGQPYREVTIDIRADGSYEIDAHDPKTREAMLNKMLEIQNLRPENVAAAKLGEAKEPATSHTAADPAATVGDPAITQSEGATELPTAEPSSKGLGK